MLKDDYLPKLNDWINNGFDGEHIIAGDFMKKRGGMIGGRRSVAAVFTGNPQSVQFGLEGHILPIASSSTATQLDIIARGLRYRLAFTEESQMAAKKGNAAAWAAPKAAELEMARNQLSNNVARNLHHGRYHPLGMLDSTSATTNLVFQGINERRSTAATFYNLGAKHVFTGMDVMLIDVDDGLGGRIAYDISTTGALRSRVTATSKSSTTAPSCTVDNSLAGATYKNAAYQEGDLIVPYGSRRYAASYPSDATSIGHFASFNGMVDFYASSTLVPYVMGNTRSGVDGLTPQYLENSGTQQAFTKLMMHNLNRRIRDATGKGVDTLLHGSEMFIEIAKEDFSGQRYDAVLGKSGWKGLSFVDNAVELKYREDAMCLPGVIWAYDSDQLGYFEQKELSAPPGYEGEHAVQDYATSEVVATKMGNVMCKRPQLGGGQDDLIFDCFNLT